MRAIVNLSWALLLLILLGFAFIWHNEGQSDTFGCGYTSEGTFCGVIDVAANSEELNLGKSIFRNNCASCHAGDMRTDLTGPALQGSIQRWQEHGDTTALYAWVRNSQAMIATGENKRANDLWQVWGPTLMNSFENLTQEELNAVFAYVEAMAPTNL